MLNNKSILVTGGTGSFGNLLVELVIKKFKPKKIMAAVLKFNVRSQKCFLKNGFIKIDFNPKKHKTINKFKIKKENYYEFNRGSMLNLFKS